MLKVRLHMEACLAAHHSSDQGPFIIWKYLQGIFLPPFFSPHRSESDDPERGGHLSRCNSDCSVVKKNNNQKVAGYSHGH